MASNQARETDLFSQLVVAFRRHGTRWYELDESYDLTAPAHVAALLLRSEHFTQSAYTDMQIRAKAAVIARAALDAGNGAWVGHPDNDLHDTALATRELSACIQAVVES